MRSIIPESASRATVMMLPSNEPYYLALDNDEQIDLFLGKFGKKVGNAVKSAGEFVGDVAQAAAYVVAAPVNSVTGHNYKPDYQTKAGHAVGVLGEMGVDGIHTAGKTFADTISGGNASKLANKLRDPENQESMGNYLENTRRGDEEGVLGKVRNATLAIGEAIGKLYGDKANKKNPFKFPNAGEEGGYTPEEETPSEDGMMVHQTKIIIIVGAFLLILLLLLLL